MACRHWIGTVPKDSPNSKFWENEITLEHIQYIKGQEEQGKGENGYVHYQIYLVLKQKKRLTWLKKHIHPTAHWEKKRGTVAEAIDYVSKEDTRVQGGLTIEIGERPSEQTEAAREKALGRIREKDEVQLQAQDILETLNTGKFLPWREIPTDIQMKPGFLMAYNKATRDMVGPERENLQIITIIGPPGCGKSYAISKTFPDAGRWIKGNNGNWFCNTKSKVMIFEEFSGQIELQSMLKYLDPYPLALEVKGGTEPAMYELVIITSNTPIDSWYTTAEEFKDKSNDPLQISTAKQRRIDALGALWDRLGYKKISRTCGHCYTFAINPILGPIEEQIQTMRDEIMQILLKAKQELTQLHSDKIDTQPIESSDSESEDSQHSQNTQDSQESELHAAAAADADANAESLIDFEE